MALTKALIYINVMKFCKDDIKIQNTEQTENQIKHRKSSFAKEYVETADSYKPVLNKMMITCV